MQVEFEILERCTDIIEEEFNRRVESLKGAPSEGAYDHWLFYDLPFLGEFAGLFLVGIWHLVERELKRILAVSTHDERFLDIPIKPQELGKARRERHTWGTLREHFLGRAKLELSGLPNFDEMDLLNSLTNFWKHEASRAVTNELLEKLELTNSVNYAPVFESDAIREALSKRLGIKDGEYPDIVRGFLDRASKFLEAVSSKTMQRRVKRRAVSLNPRDAAH